MTFQPFDEWLAIEQEKKDQGIAPETTQEDIKEVEEEQNILNLHKKKNTKQRTQSITDQSRGRQLSINI